MILQRMGNTQVVYIPDIDAGHIAIGESMGLCDIHGVPAHHALVEKIKYTTDCGEPVDAWHMAGQTVDMYVIPSRVKIKNALAHTLCSAFNSFNSPVFEFGRYVFTGKFTCDKRTANYTIADKMGRRITTYKESIKDFPGIFNLLGHLGDNNGALFHPVIARYMWGIWHIMRGRTLPIKYHPIGYIDLHEYLCVMRDDRKDMFSRTFSRSLINIQFASNPYVEVSSIDPVTGQAKLAVGNAVVIDRERDKAFRPYVLVTTKPIDIRDELKFRWTKVMFEGHAVFLIPVMVCPQSFVNGIRMVDLLSPKQL